MASSHHSTLIIVLFCLYLYTCTISAGTGLYRKPTIKWYLNKPLPSSVHTTPLYLKKFPNEFDADHNKGALLFKKPKYFVYAPKRPPYDLDLTKYALVNGRLKPQHQQPPQQFIDAGAPLKHHLYHHHPYHHHHYPNSDVKPVVEHIEGDIKYDFRTKTHSYD